MRVRMTREEAILIIGEHKKNAERLAGKTLAGQKSAEAFNMAIESLSAEPCEDAISRQAALVCIKSLYPDMPIVDIMDARRKWREKYAPYFECENAIESLHPVTPKQKMGHCKECKYFECDSVAKVDGIPLIVAHEICSKWGGGCKTNEDGYCFLYEPQESEEAE